MDELKIKVTLRGEHATRLRVSLPQGLTIRDSEGDIIAQYVSDLPPTAYADPTDGLPLVEVQDWDGDADQPDVAPHLVIPWLAAAALLARHTPDSYRDRMTMARCLAGGLLRGIEGQATDEDTPAFDGDDIAGLIVSVWTAMDFCPRDVEAKARAVVDEARQRLTDPDGKVGGWPKLERLFGDAGNQVVRAAKLWLGVIREAGEANTGKPSVVTNWRDYADVVNDCITLMARLNDPPTLFHSGGRLHVLDRPKRGTASGPLGEEAASDTAKGAALVPLELHRFRGIAADRMVFLATRKNASEQIEPPTNLLHTVLARGSWPGIPQCDIVTDVPLVAADGTVQTDEGYCAASRTYLTSDRYRGGPDAVTREDAVAAAQWFFDWPLSGFPFEDEASRVHALCAILQGFLMLVIDSNTPLIFIDALMRSSGKTLLAEFIMGVSCDAPKTMALPDTEQERLKTLVSTLMERPSHLLFDNVSGEIRSSTLDGVLTSRVYSARILGHSTNMSVPINATFLMTGNQGKLSTDLASRSMYIRLDARCENPEERDGFKIKNLLGWLQENRVECIHRALTILAYWVGQGMPPYGGHRRHRQGRWASVMGGVMEAVGLGEHFLGNTRELSDNMDEETRRWRSFVEAWWQEHSGEAVGGGDLMVLAFGRQDSFGHVVEADGVWADKMWTTSAVRLKAALGKWLVQMTGRIFSGYQITCSKDAKNGNKYRLNPIHVVPSESLVEQIGAGPPQVSVAVPVAEAREIMPHVFHAIRPQAFVDTAVVGTPDWGDELGG